MSDRRLWIALLLGAAASVGFSIAFASASVVVGSAEGRWVYRYVVGFPPDAVVIAALAIAAAACLLRLPDPRTAAQEWMIVAAWFFVAFALQAFVRSLTPFPMESMFVSDGANSFYTATQRHEASVVLADFSRVRRESPLHAQSNMPGKLMLLYGLQLLSTRTDVLPWLLVALSNIGGVLMYLFVRDLFANRTTALYAMVLYLFVPGKLFFFPLLNTVTPVILLACLWLLTRWLRTGSWILAAALGVGLYALVFFEPLPLVSGLLFAAVTLRAIVLGTTAWQTIVLHGAAVVLAFICTAEVITLGSGFNLVAAFQRLSAHAVEFNAVEGRPYGVWVLANIREFIIGAGPCQVVLALAALPAGLSSPGCLRGRLVQPVVVVSGSLLAGLVATDLIGVNRGEVIRLWIFFACLWQIPAAYVCTRLRSRTAVTIVLSSSILLAAIGTSMVGFVVP